LNLIDHQEEFEHAKGKRWTEDKEEKEKSLKNGEGLCGGAKQALPNSRGCSPSGSGLCLSRSESQEERFSKAMD
jgi:hypothetical protein